ncbi:probable ATP-dependent RNA helicase DHX40 [Sphaerodactylus townsendi]|uniref:probable ATP-dependent RNA helicase DHX40 n=1 Tax=Sphaerodactylus townsendi TaxID=933632 RepID=UPI002026DF46|nr:probable ATP-dependent RNA helicase DHX40 [Sphaerodactylus townsendi]
MDRKSKLPRGERKEHWSFETLPISRYRKKLVEAVRDNAFLVVTGETGSGKTTQLPKYLFQEGFANHGLIGVTQPRRVAAMSVAQRVAEEMNCPLGSTVGYQVRFEECFSEDTSIKYMTDGCLLRQVLADPHLSKYSVVILDEAHERSLSTFSLKKFGVKKRIVQFKLKKQLGRNYISQESLGSEAFQRAGRAGRTASGQCYRVYSKEFWEECMPDHMVPEIRRTSLTSVVLTLKCLAIHDVIRFPYLDRPEERRILEALKQLYQCSAIDRRGRVTKLGEFMVQFPLPPTLACAVIQSISLGCEHLLLPIAAMLSVENVFIRPGNGDRRLMGAAFPSPSLGFLLSLASTITAGFAPQVVQL